MPSHISIFTNLQVTELPNVVLLGNPLILPSLFPNLDHCLLASVSYDFSNKILTHGIIAHHVLMWIE